MSKFWGEHCEARLQLLSDAGATVDELEQLAQLITRYAKWECDMIVALYLTRSLVDPTRRNAYNPNVLGAILRGAGPERRVTTLLLTRQEQLSSDRVRTGDQPPERHFNVEVIKRRVFRA